VLVPAFNEERTIGRVLQRLLEVDFGVPVEIIAVDDGSSDGTWSAIQAAASAGVHALKQDVNQGKGAAIQRALAHATGSWVVVQDADLELDPSEIPRLLAAARERPGSVCYGSRFLASNRQFWLMPTYWANRVLTLVSNLLNRQRLTDMNTCYKLMPRDVARRLGIESPGFAMEAEITTKLAARGVPIQEVPVTYRPRAFREGKKIRARDMVRYFRAMLTHRSDRPR
jgi:glycosyltransferase involved in cell wall biosynthesis